MKTIHRSTGVLKVALKVSVTESGEESNRELEIPMQNGM